MKVYHIVISMLVTLAVLFIFAPIFRKWEQRKSKLEVKYFEKLRNYIKANRSDESLLENIKDLAKMRYKIEDAQMLKSQIETDLNNFEAIK